MFWDTFSDKPKEAEKLTVTCYESRRCQFNGPFSFLFVFPILLCKHLVFCWKFFCYAILFPVATRWEAPSWYHLNCLEDGWDAGSRSEGAVQSVSWASNVDCVRVELSASPACSSKILLPPFLSCSNLLFRRENKFLCSKLYYSSVRNQRDLSRVEKIESLSS